MNYKSFTQIVILGSSTFVPFMQLPIASRREVVEDLLDIKIFSSMNMLIKEKIRGLKETTRTLELKKESLKDKVDMQKNFIDEINKLSDESIKGYEKKIDKLQKEVEDHMVVNESLSEKLLNKQTEMKEFEDSSKKLTEMGNIKGKLSQRIQTIVKEHKFFSENTVCPTCNQDIKEEFRVNRITDSHDKGQRVIDWVL